MITHRSSENKQTSANFFYGVTTLRMTHFSDFVETDSNVLTVFGYAGDDVIVSWNGTQTIWSGDGTDTIVVSCRTVNLILPDHNSGDFIDITAFGITSNASSLLTFTQGTTYTLVTFTIKSRTVNISIPLNVPFVVLAQPKTVQCSLDLGVGYYPSLTSCIYVCPCDTRGLYCNFTDAKLTSPPLATTTNVFCNSYTF